MNLKRLKIFSTVLRAILGLVFCASSILKLVSINEFEVYLTSFGLFGFDVASLLGRLLVVAELLLGFGLLSGWWPRLVNGLVFAVTVFFSAFLVWRVSAGDRESCHCFGTLVEMNPAQSLIKNAVALVILAFVALSPGYRIFASGRSRASAFLWKHRTAEALAVSVLTLATVFTINPPDFFYRWSNHISSDLNPEEFQKYTEGTALNSGRRMVFFYSPECEHCCHCAAKMDVIIDWYGIPRDSCSAFFMQTVPDDRMQAEIDSFWSRCASGRSFDSRWLHPFLYLPVTNGNMPLVCLFEDGSLIREYDIFSIDGKAISAFFSD